MIPTEEYKREQRCIFLIQQGYTYDPITGKIYGKRKQEITSIDAAGYVRITISIKGMKNEYLKGHQFAWYYIHKKVEEQIDHINGIKSDNRIINLREANAFTNQWNSPKAKGYSWHKTAKKWKAQIKVNNKVIHLGLFSEKEKAREAYLEAKKVHHII